MAEVCYFVNCALFDRIEYIEYIYSRPYVFLSVSCKETSVKVICSFNITFIIILPCIFSKRQILKLF